MPCTLNAVGLLSSRRGDARVANPCPTTSCVCVEKCTLPYLTLPLGLGSQAAGAWEQVGCTSADFNTRKGLTGLGGAPFTSPAALFYCYDGGAVCAKEVLRLFGRPVLLNELRGEYGFSPDGALMQERRCRDYPRVPEITRDHSPDGGVDAGAVRRRRPRRPAQLQGVCRRDGDDEAHLHHGRRRFSPL